MARKRREEEPLYLISIVSRMLGVHPQTLRMYEREGLVTPQRDRKQRLYSERDVERITFILQLTRELGVNRAGVDIILRMKHRMEVLQQEMDEMMEHLESDMRRQFREKLRQAFQEED